MSTFLPMLKNKVFDLVVMVFYILHSPLFAQPDISVTPDTVDFSIRGVGGEYTEQMTILNLGNEDLNISNVSTSAPFAIENIAFPLVISAADSYMIDIIFTPTEDNNFSENILISSNDADNAEKIIPLYGESIEAPTGLLVGCDGQEGILLAINPESGISDTLYVVETADDQIDYITELEFRHDGTLFVARGDGYEELFTVNLLAGSTEKVGDHPNGGLPGMDFSADGKLYANYFNTRPDSSWLVIVDQDNATFEFIGNTGYKQIRGLTFSANGTLYGVGPDTTNGDSTDILMTIDTETGAVTKIGQTGFVKIASLEFGPDSVLYAGLSQRVPNDQDGGLLTIDRETGAASFVGLTSSGALSGLTFFPQLTVTTVFNNDEIAPAGFNLQQNYPNPFNPVTTINFSLNKPDFVSLKVYNITGQLVKTLISKQLQKGQHSYLWNAAGLASGFYFYQLETGSHIFTKKAILVK